LNLLDVNEPDVTQMILLRTLFCFKNRIMLLPYSVHTTLISKY